MVVAFILKYLPVINLKFYRLTGFIFLIVSSLCAQSPDVASLQKQREQYEKEISNAKKLLIKKGNTRKSYLTDLKLINAQIASQNKVILSYKKEIDAINDQLALNRDVVSSLEVEINTLRDAYKKLILAAHQQMGSNYNEFMLVFSAKSFSEAYRRFHLMKQYASYRKKQGLILMETKSKHDSILRQNELILKDKETRYLSLVREIENLKMTVSKKQKYVSDLMKDERWLRQEILKKKNAAAKLQASIEKLIHEASSVSSYAFSNFKNAKGYLKWPVSDGIVTSQFGEHNHAVLKGIKIKNNGIDITASKENSVKSVYEGTVSRVIAIPGYNKAVIIRHGKYLTVYANLSEVSVKSGQVVKSDERIGYIFADGNEKNGILHFEIWEENKKINPLEWLKN